MVLNIRTSQDAEELIKQIQALDFDKGQIYEASIKRKPKKRTIPQNKLYHMWLNCIADETGEDKDDLHKVFAKKFLGVEQVDVLGEKIGRIKSTASLDTVKFTEYLERIRAFVSLELGIILPDPDDYFFSQFEDKYD